PPVRENGWTNACKSSPQGPAATRARWRSSPAAHDRARSEAAPLRRGVQPPGRGSVLEGVRGDAAGGGGGGDGERPRFGGARWGGRRDRRAESLAIERRRRLARDVMKRALRVEVGVVGGIRGLDPDVALKQRAGWMMVLMPRVLVVVIAGELAVVTMPGGEI